MITLRPATLETVRPLRLRAPDSDWRFWIDGTLIAFDGDTPVGMANLNLDREPAEIFGVWVAPEARGKGVGRLLVSALLDRARDRELKLCVAETSRAARRLYERMGFRPTGATGALRPGSDLRTIDLRRESPG
jgi:ribosomal protein S18 acetylase RimI-like enzyme